MKKQLRVVDRGETWFLFGARYQTPDGPFCLDFYARSAGEAAAIVQDIKETLTLDGQIADIIPG